MALTGVQSHIVGLVGKHFPTGAHKVWHGVRLLGAAVGFGPVRSHHAKGRLPSTGNYCRGGAFDIALLGCTAVAILPEQMSRTVRLAGFHRG